MQTEHYTQLLSQTADAYRHCITPGRVLSAQSQPQGIWDTPELGTGGYLELEEGMLGLARSWSFGGGYIPRTEIIPGKNKTIEAQCSPPHDVGWEILPWLLRPSITMHPCVPGSDYPQPKPGRPGRLLSHNAGDIHFLVPDRDKPSAPPLVYLKR